MKHRKKIFHCFFIIGCFIFYSSCTGQEPHTSPENYDLNHPEKIILGQELNEISGITYIEKDSSVFAIDDETGDLYKIFLYKKNTVQQWKFAKNSDFEDVVLQAGAFYVLSSNGNIFVVTASDTLKAKATEFKFHLAKNAEFETLYFDNALNKLILICKDCKEDKKKDVSTFAFDIATESFSNGPFTIDADKIAALLTESKTKFKPSAAAINPLTNELFILSSVNKVLVIADRSGDVKSVYKLDPTLYKQPEGIAFTPSGDLLISNESASQGLANIFIIRQKK